MKDFARRLLGLSVGLTALFAAGTVSANVVTIPQSALVESGQYYTDMIGGGIGTALTMTGGGNAANVGGQPNDDGFSGAINLGFTLNFFGQDYTQFWANNNGNISFSNGIAAYTPDGPTGAPEPIISPFFADVDTRGTDSGLMYLRNDIDDEIILTWDGVGYYDGNDDLLNSFQLVLRGPGYDIPDGQGAIGFFYKDMQWETGDASGGAAAAVGFGDGNGNGVVLVGSTHDGISGVVENHYVWFDSNFDPIDPPTASVPAPSVLPLMLLGLLMMAVFSLSRRRNAETGGRGLK